MTNKVLKCINQHKLLSKNDLYVVALSGGADSVALLLLLLEQGYRVEAAHCNFHLRGEESDRDERFCMELCAQRGVVLHRAHFDTRTYAELHKVSIEMAARELRYRWFGQLCADIGAAGVCVAHHRDDSVETVLLNLVRGTGLRGLTGIQPQSWLGDAKQEWGAETRWLGDAKQERGLEARWLGQRAQSRVAVLRPLLCVSRSDIEDYLQKRGQAYVTDSTNLETDVQRNKVRLQLLPLLRELNPAVAENIQRMAEHLTEAQQVLDAIAEKYKVGKILELKDLEKYGSSEYFVYEWARKYGFNGRQVEQAVKAETGSVFTSATGWDLLVDRGRLLVEPSLKPMKPLKIPEEGLYVMEKCGSPTAEHTKLRVQKRPAYVSKAADVATLDAGKVRFPLIVRRVEEGDRMEPYGMKGKKLLSDLMTDRKMTVFEKRRQLVVVDAQGIIVWAVGLRTDGRVAVTAETREVLELRFEGPKP